MANSKKIGLVLFRVFLVIVALELALRLSEWGYYAYHKNRVPADVEASQDAFRVICLGESSVEGFPLTKREEAFPNQLDKLLKERYPDKKIIVYNLGVSGITSIQISEFIIEKLNKYKPHLVITMLGNNCELPHNFRKQVPYVFHVLSRSKVFKMGEFIAGIYNRAIWRKKYYINFDWYDQEIMGFHRKRNIKEVNYIIDRCREYGAKVIICNYFSSWINPILEQISKERSAIFCDIERLYQNYIKTGKSKDIMLDDLWHPNPKGHRMIAEKILQVLEESKILDVVAAAAAAE